MVLSGRLASKVIHIDRVATIGDVVPALLKVRICAAEYRRGGVNLENDPRTERSATAITEADIDSVQHLMRLNMNQMTNDINISRKRVGNILYNDLDTAQ